MLDRPGIDRPARSRLPQDARRQQLVDAAVAAIAEFGLSNVTLGKVAARAGLAASMVNFHFESKQDLLKTVLRTIADDYRAACESSLAAAGPDPAAGLVALCEASFDPAVADPDRLAVWYAFWGESRTRGDYMEVCGSSDQAFYDAVLSLVVELAEREGAVLDGRAAALGLAGLIDALSQEALVQGRGFDHAAAVETCRRYLANLFPKAYLPLARAHETGVPERTPHEAREGIPSLADGEDEDLPLTLPSWTYRDAAFTRKEIEEIHTPAWHLLCHVSEMPNVGDYRSISLLGKRVFAIRGDDGEIRAFHNVCRHRAHEIVTAGAGHVDGQLQCAYHAWCYDRQGVLKGIAASRTFPKLDKDNLGLFPVECEVFLGFVFIRLAPGGPSVAERYAPYAAELAPHRLEELVPIAEAWDGEIAADWKNVWDNYLEDYHFPTGHPGLSGLMKKAYDREPDAATRTIRLSHAMRDDPAGGWATRAYASLVGRVNGHLPEGLQRRWSYLFMYPAFSLELYPDMIDYFHIIPVGPGRSRLRWRAFARPGQGREGRAVQWLNQRINLQVHHEDGELVESVQRNLAAGAYERGVLSEMEVNVQALHAWIASDLPEAR